MHRFLTIAMLVAAASASAQWVHYPTAGIPRTKDGKPNLSAPAPRTQDGKPDLSGVWEVLHNRPCPPDGCDDMWIPQEFLDIGWSLKGGLPYQPWAAEIVKRTQADRSKDPNSHCLPTGIVRMYTTPLFRKIIQTPGLLVILNEREAMYRQIFTDGRPLPVDPQPSWVGYSTGKWEGDTLVVQTERLPRRAVAGCQRQPADGIGENHGAYPARELREAGDRDHGGRSQGVHQTVDGETDAASGADTDLLDYYCVENEKDGPHLVGK